VNFAGRRWRKSSSFELEGHVNGGGDEGKNASSTEREDRESVCQGGDRA